MEALHDFFIKLEKAGVGRARTEHISKDLVFQIILRTLDLEAKAGVKGDQQRVPHVVRALLRTQMDMICDNISMIRTTINRSIVQVVKAEGRQLRGDRHRRLERKSRDLNHQSYQEKWKVNSLQSTTTW